MTTTELARRFGINRSHLARLERGTSMPSAELQRQFMEAGVCEPNDWFAPAVELEACTLCALTLNTVDCCLRSDCPQRRAG